MTCDLKIALLAVMQCPMQITAMWVRVGAMQFGHAKHFEHEGEDDSGHGHH